MKKETHEAITEAAAGMENRFLTDWKNEGKKIIGYTCSYIPDEIFHAAGILPYRLRGFSTEASTIADTYFGPFICSFPKSLLQLAGEGMYNFLDGAIITAGCDSMRRLDECWRKANDDREGILPDFFFYYGVPHKNTSYSRTWFIQEIEKLVKSIEDHFDITITRESIYNSIELYNKSRMLLKRIDDLRTGSGTIVSGADALSIILAGTAIPREIYNTLLEEIIIDLEEEQKKNRANGKKRLMLVGSVNDDIDLVRLIEGEQAIVVADNLCFGSRFYNDLVALPDNSKTENDPVALLAERYLGNNECPRMFGDYKKRLSMLKEKIEVKKIEGVILQNIRFCDLHGSENGLFERDLEAQGVPCMRLEREYGPLVESGRIKMRVDAFLERLAL